MNWASEDLRSWRLARVDPLEVNPGIQLHGDPDEVEGIERIAVIVAGELLPLARPGRHPEDEYPWLTWDGPHRQSAAHTERVGLLACVARVGCCGGPDADLPR